MLQGGSSGGSTVGSRTMCLEGERVDWRGRGCGWSGDDGSVESEDGPGGEEDGRGTLWWRGDMDRLSRRTSVRVLVFHG